MYRLLNGPNDKDTIRSLSWSIFTGPLKDGQGKWTISLAGWRKKKSCDWIRFQKLASRLIPANRWKGPDWMPLTTKEERRRGFRSLISAKYRSQLSLWIDDSDRLVKNGTMRGFFENAYSSLKWNSWWSRTINDSGFPGRARGRRPIESIHLATDANHLLQIEDQANSLRQGEGKSCSCKLQAF